jgi:hypothetical protein
MTDSERAREFLDVWEAENVERVPESEKIKRGGTTRPSLPSRRHPRWHQ